MAGSGRQRFEKKYLIDIDTACILKQRASYVMKPDSNGKNGEYHISSLYFDDQYNTAFYEKQNGVSGREKYRVRYYNGDTGRLRLERKLKRGEMVLKEGTALEPEHYQMMCRAEYSFMSGESNPVYESFYTSNITGRMKPAVNIGYNRLAYAYPAGNVRMTFDSGITAGNPMSGFTFPVIPEDRLILEIKYSRFIPEVITGLLTGIQFTQQLALSKFAMSILALQGVYV